MTQQPTNLGIITSRDEFSNTPMEYVAPKKTDIIYVTDFFANEISGGAELTGECIMDSSPYNVFKIHSSSISEDFIKRHKDKHFIFGNYVMCSSEFVNALLEYKINYSVIEFDYKYCIARSEVLHKKQTAKDCDCSTNFVGKIVEIFYLNAKQLFWMSEEQKNIYISKFPSLKDKNHVVQSSTFDEKTLKLLAELKTLRESRNKLPIKIYGVQGSNNWIKGTKETIEYCNKNRYAVKVLQNMSYEEFLKELSKCDVFIFHPLDFDTCPRVVIEAKLMGLDVDLNDNVQIKNERWLNSTHEELLGYISARNKYFWDNFNL